MCCKRKAACLGVMNWNLPVLFFAETVILRDSRLLSQIFVILL